MEKQLFTVNSGFELDDLVLEVKAKGGRPILLFPPSYLIAEVLPSVSLRSGSIFKPARIDVLDLQARTAVQTLQRSQSPASAPSIPLSWDTPGKESPRAVHDPVIRRLSHPHTPSISSPMDMSTGTPTSLYLIGRVAVALVIVSREHGTGTTATPEHITQTERDNAAVEATEGLIWLATLEPRAQVNFVIDRHDIEINIIPNQSTPDTYEDLEAVWRDPALLQLRLNAGSAGYAQLARDVRDRNQAQWGFVLFITRYRLHHFAYSSQERVVQHYDNDGWGSLQLNRVIAHETCHIFGAQDEYASSNCNCTTKSGQLQVENGNCRLCATQFVNCIMEANALEMCNFTRGQIGWRAPLLRWNFVLQTGTGLHKTQDNFEFFFVDWDRDGIPDLLAVKKSETGTKSTEVHIFSGASGFTQPILQTGTALHETDNTFQFCVTDDQDGRPDLVAIKKSRTGTNSTEVHVLSGASNFQQFILQTGTALHETDKTFQFSMVHWDSSVGSGRHPDLLAIKKSGTGTGSTEVHIFSGASNFTVPLLQTGTVLHETDATFDIFAASFERSSLLPDLIAIKKANTGTRSTEIHVLSGRSLFQQFIVQSSSALHETDDSFAFAPVQWDKLNDVIEIAAIKKRITGTHSTEIHILKQ